MEKLFSLLTQKFRTKNFAEASNVFTDPIIGASLLTITSFINERKDCALIAPNQYAAQRIYEFLLSFLKEEEIAFFPSDELLRAESLASSSELLAQRLYALGILLKPQPKILITHPSALLRFLPDPALFKESLIEVKKGERISLSNFKKRLSTLGYRRVDKIDQSLQYAARGDVVDVFSVNSLNPCRIEFFGDEIDSLREFDIATQASLKQLESLQILPAHEFLLKEEEKENARKKIEELLLEDKKRLPEERYEILKDNVERECEDFLQGSFSSFSYKFFSLLRDSHASVLDYFKPRFIYITDQEGFDGGVNLLLKEAHDYYYELYSEGKLPSKARHYLDLNEVFAGRKKIIHGHRYRDDSIDFELNVRPAISYSHSLDGLTDTLNVYRKTQTRVLLTLPDLRQRSLIEEELKEQKISYVDLKSDEIPPSDQIGINNLNLVEGFELPDEKLVVLSPKEIFGQKSHKSRFSSRFQNATILRTYEDLKVGDYVVHEYNGIGQYLGIKDIESEGIHRDYLEIVYANEEKLFVPLEQFRLIRKYAGREGASPRLSHLFSGEWDKRKKQIKERVNELADRLLVLYRDRVKIPGYAFPEEDLEDQKFASAFPYELTPDQMSSWEEIKKDMEKPEIMDRLLCGDVGFGKTEIAFRAAFKALKVGKQVALLCPTTLLARQHFLVAKERFRNFPMKIAMFSRLLSPKEIEEEKEELAAGKIDFAIGTHALLAKDLKFRDLGLLIVDEEQRFGVEQKEKIKELARNVDVLTLSATPIPRTLQMSLVGLRPLSEINTAPKTRMPVQTYVAPYKEKVVAELLSRELARGGQAFYVYNKVASIYSVAHRLSSLLPEARFSVVHGQMAKEEIEDAMNDFYDGKTDVLVATSIVENGIDIPNANLLIVEDADAFGLSQLYQIKGRVGRGDRVAYAYLFYRPGKELNEEARKRLEAIQEFTELGSGYKIAQRDLMIRGAGDILGPEQAGFIDSIGLDLYLKMLNEAVEERKTGAANEKPPRPVKVFKINAYIPDSYASNEEKVEIYQEIENAKDSDYLKEYAKHLKDMHGPLPQEVQKLFKKRDIDLLLDNEEFASIEDREEILDLLLSSSFSRVSGIGARLFKALEQYLPLLKVSFLNRQVRIQITKRPEIWLDDLLAVLKTIHLTYRHSLSHA